MFTIRPVLVNSARCTIVWKTLEFKGNLFPQPSPEPFPNTSLSLFIFIELAGSSETALSFLKSRNRDAETQISKNYEILEGLGRVVCSFVLIIY